MALSHSTHGFGLAIYAFWDSMSSQIKWWAWRSVIIQLVPVIETLVQINAFGEPEIRNRYMKHGVVRWRLERGAWINFQPLWLHETLSELSGHYRWLGDLRCSFKLIMVTYEFLGRSYTVSSLPPWCSWVVRKMELLVNRHFIDGVFFQCLKHLKSVLAISLCTSDSLFQRYTFSIFLHDSLLSYHLNLWKNKFQRILPTEANVPGSPSLGLVPSKALRRTQQCAHMIICFWKIYKHKTF